MDKKELNRRRSVARVEEILAKLRSGQSSVAINAAQDALIAQRELGEQSEENVLSVVGSLPYVYRAFKLSDNPGHDKRGRDIGVHLNPGKFARDFHAAIAIQSNAVYIEVKSSSNGIWNYKNTIMTNFELSDEDEFWEWMQKERKTILNGQSGEDKITKDFKNQLATMNNYWLSHENS